MAGNEVAKPEIVVGTPKSENGAIIFTGASHPREKEVQDALSKAEATLKSKLDATSAYITEFAALPKDANAAAIDAMRKKHAPTEYEAFVKANAEQGKVTNELRIAQGKHLNKAETVIEGLAAGEERTKQIKAFHSETKKLDRLANPTMFKTHFAVARELGIGAALDRNLGKTAWKESKGRLALRGTGLAVGLGMMGHASFFSQKVDAEGKTTDRSLGARVLEFTGGAGLATVSALHGGR